MSNEKVTIALLGCGYTLSRVAAQLPLESVVLVTQREVRARELAEWHPHVVSLDICNKEALASLWDMFPTLKVIVDSVPPIRGKDETKPEAGARAIADTLPDSVERFIYLSTTGVFGETDGQEVDEQTEPNPIHVRGEARLAVESVYRELPLETVSLRLPAIYGPGRGTGLSLQKGRYPYLEDGMRWSNRIHVDDLARVITKIVRADFSLPPVLCITDDSPSLTKEVVGFYCDKFSFPFPVSISLEEARQKGMLSLLSNQRVSNALMKELLQIELHYPSYKEGAGTEFESS